MSKKLLLLLMCQVVLSFNVLAQEDSQVVIYEGVDQEAPVIILNRIIDVTRYRQEEYEDTCYNTEYYDERVCENVTHYRTESRYSTCYRRSCSTSYRQSCRDVPHTRRVCHSRPSRTHCRTVQGRERCTTIPGGEVCNNVTTHSRECHNEPYQSCHQESYGCYEDVRVPYTVNECRDVTRSRQIPYDCISTRDVPYIVQIPYEAKVTMNYTGESLEKHEFKVLLNEKGAVMVTQENSTEQLVRLLPFAVERIEGTDEEGVFLDVITNIEFVSQSELAVENITLEKTLFHKKDHDLSFVLTNFEGLFPLKGKLFITERKSEESLVDHNFSLVPEMIDEEGKLTFNLESLGMSKKLKMRKHKIQVIFSKPLAGLLNPEGAREIKTELNVDLLTIVK